MEHRILTSNYVLDIQKNIWSRPNYAGISYSDGDETELYIAHIIERATDITILSTELRQHCTDWPTLYHLSGTRANILRPFAAALTGDILEIGAGCGAITRYLGECGANVLALEASRRRAAVARSRTRDLKNVTMLAEKFDQFQCDHQFNVITLVGVLEYANLFTTSEGPALTMLKQVRSLLKPEGKLIIAIENQLGLKYFAGAPEDHVGQPMYGIEGRYRTDQPQTFGRAVLSNLLTEAGFAKVEFLAPFPDYKLPVSILSEEGLSNKKFDGAALAWQSVRRDPQLPPSTNFSLELAWSEVFANGLALDMANSFLVVASPLPQRVVERGVLGYHYSTDRAPQYCKETVFKHTDENTIVVNYHMLGSRQYDDRGNRIIKFVCPARAPYVEGVPLSLEFIKIVTRDGWSIEEVAIFIRRYINFLLLIADQKGNIIDTSKLADKLPGDFFDLVPQNIIINHRGEPIPIDTEWSVNGDIELGWLLFRTFLLAIESVAHFGKNSAGQAFSRHTFVKSALNAAGYPCTDEALLRFIKLEAVIQQQVAGRPSEDFLNWLPEQPLPTNLVSERNSAVAERNAAIAERDLLAAKLKESQEQISIITDSNSWRLTLPLREIRRHLTLPLREVHYRLLNPQQAKRFVKQTLYVAKRTYQALPLSYQTKMAHRFFLANHFPWALRAAATSSTPDHEFSVPLAIFIKARITSDVPADSITLATSSEPQVSVIIPIYGKCNYTIRCLTSIAINLPIIPFEIIVVDDCSPDNSAETLQHVKGIRLIKNSENQGFIRSCNIGAVEAKGEYLYFLNNDTEVAPGWLDELIRTFHEFPGTGLAGSKLVYPDGTLQEAGGIIWQDGSAWNFGRNQHQLLPIYNYAREVDYCSGASIMVPKVLFEELGGFDERYLPAYCEDSDLALKIRDRGRRVIYQPLSVVVHYEGITCGTDITQGTKTYQVENSKKLFDRWKNRLQHHQEPGTDICDAKDRMAKRRVLVLDHCTPTPNRDAGSVTVFNLMLLLREMGFQVTFIPADNFLYMPDYTPTLQRVGIEVLYAPYCTSVEEHLTKSGGRYNLAFLFRPGVVERHLTAIRKHSPKAKVIFHTVDLHYLRISREASLHGDTAKQKAADEMKQRELAAIRAADLSIVHSTVELELLRPEMPNELIHVFPLIMDIRGTDKTFKDRRDVVFVGGYQHPPNIDAVQYFVSDIMPILRRCLPGVHFYAVGSKPPAEIQALAGEDVIVTGFVEDLASLLDQMRVSVAPLRYGAGIKGKIGSAMVVGLPTIATSLAAEGMSLINEENIIVADGAEAFADAVARVYEDESLWNHLSKSGLEFAKQAWGTEAAWKILASILSDIGISNERGNNPLVLYSSQPIHLSSCTTHTASIGVESNKRSIWGS